MRSQLTPIVLVAVCLVAAGCSGFVLTSDHTPELHVVVGRDGTRVDIHRVHQRRGRHGRGEPDA